MKETPIKEKVYTLSGRVNELPFSKRTSDIKNALLELKPEFCFTDTYITLSAGAGKNKITAERKLNLKQSKQLFNNEDFLTVFTQNLMVEFV